MRGMRSVVGVSVMGLSSLAIGGLAITSPGANLLATRIDKIDPAPAQDTAFDEGASVQQAARREGHA